jgi:protein ImuB
MDGGLAQIAIETTAPSRSVVHLLKLFEIKLPMIQPESGIELFILEAHHVEDLAASQEKLWEGTPSTSEALLAELLDRLSTKLGTAPIHRYLPDEHYWPERSIRKAISLQETSDANWLMGQPRPAQLLAHPQEIIVTAPIPDYPPMNFRYKGKLHKVVRADGPERIEQEWWLQQGEHRDYYRVEDEEGRRYWVFRLGHYQEEKTLKWFLHGFFP